MARPETYERMLMLVLRAAGVVLLTAFAAVFLPASWMAATHRWLGLGPFPESPLVDYLTRTLSALYGIKGGLYLLLSTDVPRYAGVIVYVALSAMGFGLAVIVIDLQAGLPWFWTLAEGPPVFCIATLLLVLARARHAGITRAGS